MGTLAVSHCHGPDLPKMLKNLSAKSDTDRENTARPPVTKHRY